MINRPKKLVRRNLANKRREKKPAWRKPGILGVSALVICVFIFFIYQHMKSALKPGTVPPYFSRLSHWVVERKNHLHHPLAKAKQIAVNKSEAEEPLHFEFYSALPNMQVDVPAEKPPAVKAPIVQPDELEKELSKELHKPTKLTKSKNNRLQKALV